MNKQRNFSREIDWKTPPLNCAALSSPSAVTVAHASKAAKNAALLSNLVCSSWLSCQHHAKTCKDVVLGCIVANLCK